MDFNVKAAMRNRYKVQVPWEETLDFSDGIGRQIITREGVTLVAHYPGMVHNVVRKVLIHLKVWSIF